FPLNRLRQPLDAPRDLLDLLPPVHVDEPLVHQPKHQLLPRPPAVRINVRVGLHVNEKALALKLLENEIGSLWINRLPPGEPPEPLAKRTVFLERGDADQSEFLADLVVDVTATGSGVNNAGSFTRDD